MPLYNLTELDVKNLTTIISAAPIKGADALTVVNLVAKLQSPINKEVQTAFPAQDVPAPEQTPSP